MSTKACEFVEIIMERLRDRWKEFPYLTVELFDGMADTL